MASYRAGGDGQQDIAALRLRFFTWALFASNDYCERLTEPRLQRMKNGLQTIQRAPFNSESRLNGRFSDRHCARCISVRVGKRDGLDCVLEVDL